MKCDNCRAAWETNNENGYEGGCYLEYLIDESDKIQYTDNGCTIHPKTLKKIMDAQDKAEAEYYASYGEWYQERCNTKETCVICGIETTGDNTTICDSNHNTVEGATPCGQIICYKCWEKQRERAIYHKIEPDCCTKRRDG